MELKIFNHFEKTYLFTIFDSYKPPKKHMFRVHNHPALELSFIKYGDSDYLLEDNKYNAKSGMMFLIRPGEQHCIPTIYSDYLSAVNIHISPYYLWNTALDYIPISALHELINNTDSANLFYGFDSYFNELDNLLQNANSDDAPIRARRIVLSLLIDICDRLLPNIQVNNSSNALSLNFLKIQKTISYIDSNYSEKITIDDLMSISKLNKTVFSNSFKKFTGLSAIEYITLKRLDNATHLLKYTNEKVADIAFACGFNNISHFNSTFKSKFEMTPKEYRKSFSK